MSTHAVLERLFGWRGAFLYRERGGGLVPTHVVTQVFLPADKGFDGTIWAVMPQVLGGFPVLIWRDDGVLVFVAADPNRALVTITWKRALIKALQIWLDDHDITGE